MSHLRSCLRAAGAGVAIVVWAEACGPAEPPRSPAPPPSSVPVASSPDASSDAGTLIVANNDGREPPAPKTVDTSLSAPDYAELVATAPDGATLLAIHGWRAVSPDTRGSTVYLAVLDARHACIEETLSFDGLTAAGGTGTVPEALAALKSRAVGDEIHRAWVVARRFGLRDLESVAFGADESFVVVEANNALYVRSGGPSAPFTHHPIGTSTRLAASHDGSQIAFANCGSPCGGSYAPAILDVKTKEVRRFPVGSAHAFYWSKDDTSLLFSYDDRAPGQYESSKVCVGRVAGAAKRATTVTCLASGVMSTSISAASPSGAFVGLQVESRSPPVRVGANGKVVMPPPATTPSRAFVVLEMPSGAESYRVAASPIFPSMDDQGRVAWDDNDTPKFHMRVRVASRGAAEAVLPDARSAGFLPDGTVLVLPFDKPSNAVMSEPLHTLAEKRCGLFSVWKP